MIKPPFAAVWQLAEQIDSAVTKRECAALYECACNVSREKAIVEIGSYTGRSSSCLAMAARVTGSHVWCVDTHMGDEHSGYLRTPDGDIASTLVIWKHNLSVFGVIDAATPIVKDSVQAGEEWDGPEIGMIFIDGFHSYEQCKADFDIWEPHLTADAIVCFHDYTQKDYGVKKAVDELKKGKRVKVDVIIDSMAVCKVLKKLAP